MSNSAGRVVSKRATVILPFIPYALPHKHLRFDTTGDMAMLRQPFSRHPEAVKCGGTIVLFLRTLMRDRAGLAAENLALRQQLAILEQRSKRPRLRKRDRIFWAWLSRLWSNWRSVLIIVQAETIIRWHQQGFQLYWRWKSRKKPGRPRIDAEIRSMIWRTG